jgi:hypothetical protein
MNGCSSPATVSLKIQEGLEFARVLVRCMSTGKHNIRLTEKRPGITDIGADATITFTYAIGLCCDETYSKPTQSVSRVPCLAR